MVKIMDSENDGDQTKLDRAENLLKVDLRLTETLFGADLFVTGAGDISVARSEMNLAQAVLHRLRTIKGELVDTGHPTYGSTLYDFIGAPNNELTRERLKLAVRSTLLEEPRIKEILEIAVTARPINAHMRESEIRNVPEATSKITETPLTESELVGAEISASDPRVNLSTVDIEISILPVNRSIPITIFFPFQLEVS